MKIKIKVKGLAEKIMMTIPMVILVILIFSSTEGTTFTDVDRQIDSNYLVSEIDGLLEYLGYSETERTLLYSCQDIKNDKFIKDSKLEALSAGIGVTPGILVGKLSSEDGIVNGLSITELRQFSEYDYLIDKVLDMPYTSENLYVTADISDSAYIGDEPEIGDLVIIEYCDLHGAICGKYHDDARKQIIELFVDTGFATYYFKHLPLGVNGRISDDLAKLSECIRDDFGDSSMFRFVDGLYTNMKFDLSY